MEDNIVVLTDEDGNEIEYIFLDIIKYRGIEYVVFLPKDMSSSIVTILQLEDSGDGFQNYVSIEDDKLLDKLFKIFKIRNRRIFNFE